MKMAPKVMKKHMKRPAASKSKVKHAKKPKFTMGYWAIRGIGAPIRMVFEYCNAQYTDIQYTDEDEWHKDGGAKAVLKEKHVLMNLPYVEVNGKYVCQSNAVLRFVGKKFGLNGRGDAAETSNDEVLCQVYDLRNVVVNMVYREPDRASYEATLKKHLTDAGAKTVNDHYTKFDGLLKQSGTAFMSGNKPCTGDFALLEMLDQHEMMAKDIGMDSPLGKFPLLKAYYEKFKSLPQLQSYFSSDSYKLPVNGLCPVHFK
eukprot:gnl/MRDRNA2_/MRDRNA2_27691_c0_seq2.p1 gnl/MRDRNA2_/MRDRNA2_27691_c0~~gnl/MRDRNA2_/MRDRNA2_27691_c0_seq2.p1  ORF type:complete len:258 (+),score=44.92 gnl/MRDRNA2_/MRDRNA2_27691_c0_seq2:77-850(+)